MGVPAAAAAAADDALGAGEGRGRGVASGRAQNLGQKGLNCAHDSQILLQCYIIWFLYFEFRHFCFGFFF